jgi:cytochrome c oxidase cbb3-type subunit II
MKLDFHVNHRLLFGAVLIVFILLSCAIAIGPALWVQENNAAIPGSRPLSSEEELGLRIYVSEGCVYCHTQQVRPVAQDTLRYGRPSAPGDYAGLRPLDAWRQTPSVLGTERTGPDLANIGDRQPSSIWHHIHLFQPRALVEGSIMPAFPWLYRIVQEPGPDDEIVPVPSQWIHGGGRVVATARARALVAYLLAIRQPPLNPVRPPAPGANAADDNDSAHVGGARP